MRFCNSYVINTSIHYIRALLFDSLGENLYLILFLSMRSLCGFCMAKKWYISIRNLELAYRFVYKTKLLINLHKQRIPKQGWMKCNFDESYKEGWDSSGICWIIRNHNGHGDGKIEASSITFTRGNKVSPCFISGLSTRMKICVVWRW